MYADNRGGFVLPQRRHASQNFLPRRVLGEGRPHEKRVQDLEGTSGVRVTYGSGGDSSHAVTGSAGRHAAADGPVALPAPEPGVCASGVRGPSLPHRSPESLR